MTDGNFDRAPIPPGMEETRKALSDIEVSDFAQAYAELPVQNRDSEVGVRSKNDVDEEANEALDYLKKKHKAEINRLNSDNRQRNWFFNFVLLITLIPVLVASYAMSCYVRNGGDSEAIYVGFFASVVVEVIGLSLVIANYLFPKHGSIDPRNGDHSKTNTED